MWLREKNSVNKALHMQLMARRSPNTHVITIHRVVRMIYNKKRGSKGKSIRNKEDHKTIQFIHHHEHNGNDIHERTQQKQDKSISLATNRDSDGLRIASDLAETHSVIASKDNSLFHFKIKDRRRLCSGVDICSFDVVDDG